MASGEMSRDQFTDFLKATLNTAAKISTDGAVHYVCMDWRHVEELVTAGRSIYGAMDTAAPAAAVPACGRAAL